MMIPLLPSWIRKSAIFLNKIFTINNSVFTNEECTSIPHYQSDGYHSSLTYITINPATVFYKLSQLNRNKTPGPEGWPIFCLKESAQESSNPLSILYNKSLECSVLPKHWKEALITLAWEYIKG